MRRLFSRSLGMLVLGIWLILWGLVPLLAIGMPNADLILGLLAIVAGVLIVLGR